jgi:hypothetical protein
VESAGALVALGAMTEARQAARPFSTCAVLCTAELNKQPGHENQIL